MARRKSLAAQLYAEYQKAKRAHQREQRQFEIEQQKLAARLEREEEQRLQQAEKAKQARRRERERATRAREQEAARAERLAQQEERARARLAATERQDAERRHVEERVAEAELLTSAAAQRVASFEGILRDRSRGMAMRSRELEDVFNGRGPDAFVEALQAALATSAYPHGLHGSSAAVYRPEARELLVEYELPGQAQIPAYVSYKYVKARDAVQSQPRKSAEVKKLYQDLIAQVVLRTLSEVFDAAPVTLINEVVINAYVSAKDRMTGKPVRPLILSAHATREKFTEIILDEPELDPVACLQGHLNAIISPNPYDLEPVRPVLQFDLSNYKFVEEMSVVAGLDSRPDLLKLKPVEFEHLIRELFAARGLKAWVTQLSRDDGVDGVAVNDDPIVGGLCVIQAKRYSRIVGLEALHALAGVMDDKKAAKGVLVTTSWVGKASRDFAARNGRIEIIEGRHLKSLLLEYLGKDVLIGLPNLPPGWERRDIS